MPHKRAKASVRKARRAEMDLPVAKGDGGVTSQEAPKGFTRLLKFKEMALKRQQEKREAKSNKTAENKKLELQPGERLKDFVQRVEHEYHNDVLSAQKASKPVSGRKKRNQEVRKQKKTAKLQKELEIYGGRDFDDLKDNVKFGEVADAPPIFNKIPKARGKGKQTLEEKNRQAVAAPKKDTGYESEEDENMKALKASHKRKIQNMSAAARIQLNNEREMVIEAYRAKKAKRMADSGLA